jgi:hypothetical protein
LEDDDEAEEQDNHLEILRQNLINHATNLPVEITDQAGRRKHHNLPGLVELNEQRQFSSEARV